MSTNNSAEPVTIKVDCTETGQELVHIWNSIGFDEINWSYAPRGLDLLATLRQEVVEKAYYVRNHNAFTSGNCLSYPAGGSTNIYSEDAKGQPIYNWETVDKIYDAYVSNGFRPLIELGFLPFDLVPESLSEQATFNPAFDVGNEPYESGKWKLPPKDFTKWEKLVEAFVGHLVERYGPNEVANWYFELWNEPDIPHYWRGTVEEYCRLYDHSVAGATRAFPQVKIGGPATTDKGVEFLQYFLKHCTQGQNFVTGQTGTKLDFVSFHTKGAYYTPRRSYAQPVKTESPSLLKMVSDIQRSLSVIAGFPELHRLPVFVDECDPAVGTIYGVYDNPNFEVCNSEYYPSFVTALIGQLLDLNQKMPVSVRMITHWAFYFEGKRFFEGNRTLVTNLNVWNPIMAGLKMLSRLGDRQLRLESSAPVNVLEEGYNEKAQIINGLATVRTEASGENTVALLVWHHCDDWTAKGETQVQLRLDQVPFNTGEKFEIRHWRIDAQHSNAYTEWRQQGRPENPDPEQLARLRSAMQLTLLEEPKFSTLNQSRSLQLSFTMPSHAVSLVEIAKAPAQP